MFHRCGWFLRWFSFFSKIRFLLIFFTALLHLHNVQSGEIDEISIFEKSGIYHITVSAKIAASEDHIRRVITDFTHAYRINSFIIESEVLPSLNDEVIRVRAKVLCCTAWFCREAERVDEVRTLASGDIQAIIIPEQSDFYSGTALWKFVPANEKTQLIYQASIEPAFFIPPIIGTKLVIESLRNQFSEIFSRIERVAMINETREWNENMAIACTNSPSEAKPCNNPVNASIEH